MRWKARTAVLALALLVPIISPHADEIKNDCQHLIKRFHGLLDLYIEEGGKAIADGQEPVVALEQARARAVKGESQATVTLMGVTLLLYGRRDVFPVTIIRQVCGLAARNGLPIHVVTCAYFNALNPLGDREEKRRAVAVEFSRFDALMQASTSEAATLFDRFKVDMDALKACLRGA